MSEVKKVVPTAWAKVDEAAKLAMRMSASDLPPQNRRYMSANLHNYIAELFGMAKIGVVDLAYNRRQLELGVERWCIKYRWSNKAKALRLFNDAWDNVKAAENPRMFLRQHQDEEGPKRIIDEFVEKEWMKNAGMG
jgi:hypothetical protein